MPNKRWSPEKPKLHSGPEHPQAIDLMAAFARAHPTRPNAAANAETQAEDASPINAEEEGNFAPHIRRLRAVRLRATPVRVHILMVLRQCSPDCHDVQQILRALHQRFAIFAPGAVYRALKEMTETGLLVRRWGEHGRARYRYTPDGPPAPLDTLACQCGKRLAFIEDLALHTHLATLANQEGFVLGNTPVFTISTVCAGCTDGQRNKRISRVSRGRPT